MEFKKDDVVRHLGLLDLQRTMQRALRRSGLPVAYSKGFNPHMVMSFASALSAGIPGDAELLDVSMQGEVSAEECLTAMRRVLPPTLRPVRVRLVDDHHAKAGASLRYAEYAIGLYGGESKRIAEHVSAFLGEDCLMALRKTKKSEEMVNIRPMIRSLTARYDEERDEAVLVALVSFVEQATLKPELLLDTLCKHAGAEKPQCAIRRTGLYGLVEDHSVALMDL